VIRSHLRLAAGVCVLTVGLLMGGGAVAVADPGSSGSAANSTDTNQQHSTGVKSPKKKEPSDTATKDEKKEPGGTKDEKKAEKKDPGGTASKEKKAPGGTATRDEKKDEKKGSAVVVAVPDQVAPAPNAAAPVPKAVAPAPNAAAPVPTAVAPAPNVVAPVPKAVAPAPDVVAPVPNVVAPVPNLVAPVSEVIALIRDMLTSVAGAGVPLTQPPSDPYSFLLGSDVIALIQDMLTSVAGGVIPLTQLQADLYSFLSGIIAGMEPAGAGLGGVAGAGRAPAPDASLASHWRLVRALAAIAGEPWAGNATRVAPPEGIAAAIFAAMTQLGRASSPPEMAPLAPNNDAIPMGQPSFVRPASTELLLPGSVAALAVALPGAGGLLILTAAGVLPVSLAALAAVALPGAGGLVILTAAGVRIGYRQAKAGFLVRTAGIARFARPGAVPLGVVRSGSLVVVRPRALRVARAGALSAGCLLDKVA
jgi:hypothetical protein